MRKDKVLTRINKKFLNGVAHRGLHNSQLPENSVSAFKNAIDNDFAFELDVHLTKDGKVLVSHDSDLKRMCNKEGVIEELTLEEVKVNYKLPNGETLPTLNEVLTICDEKVPIVIELKPYAKTKNYKVLANKVLELLNNVRNKGNFIIISFYPQCLLPFKKHRFVRCLLVDSKNRRTYMFRFLFEGLDLEYTLLKERKYQKAFKRYFMMAWTIESVEELNSIKDFVDSPTFQYIDLKELIKFQQNLNCRECSLRLTN